MTAGNTPVAVFAASEKLMARDPETMPEQMGPEEKESLLARIARQQATAGLAHREGSSLVYEIAPDWAAENVARDPAVCRVETGLALEEAFADPDVETILIPQGTISLTVVRRVCARHGMAKTVFFEGGRNE